MKKSFFLAIALAAMAMIPAYSQQYDDEKDFKTKLIDGGKGIEIAEYAGNKSAVRIPPHIQNLPVTRIGTEAFQENKDITSVTIPDSVTGIESWAFNGCGSLASVTIGNGVTIIGYQAFKECDSLASVIIPESVTSIRQNAFQWCTSLTSVTFQGTMSAGNISSGDADPFPGDLRAKYLAGGKGTYTRADGESATWTKR
jgi:hypothetical protein